MRGTTSDSVAHAIELGYRHIDCAQIYGNQRDVGKGIADGIKRAGITRKDIWVTSKVWNSKYAHSRRSENSFTDATSHGDPRGALSSILRELGLDYIDLLLM